MSIAKNIYVFIFLFFALFGPKVYNFIDLMVIVPFVLLLGLITSVKVLRLNVEIVRILFIQSVCILWYLCSVIVNSEYQIDAVLRMIRSFASTIIILVFITTIIEKDIIKPFNLICIVIFALSINSVIILMQIYNINLQYIIAPIWGFDKTINEAKAFGLTAGYDTAGYLAVFTSVASLIVSFREKSLKFFSLFVIASISVFLTSRTSMVMYIFVIALALLGNGKYISGSHKLAIYFFAFLLSYILLPELSALLVASIVEFAIFDLTSDSDYSNVYAKTSLRDVFSDMITFPKDIFTFIWGTGLIVPWSDVGYIKIIFLSGFPFLMLTIVFYFYVFRRSIKLLYNSIGLNSNRSWAGLSTHIFLFYLLIFYISNLKNLYFFTRGYHELFIILSAVLIGSCSLNTDRKLKDK